ncbi:MAG: iron ABC transporter permease [Anaerolineae bacterium]|nr:iron ABC transporter permease [Anaerolineae bacterium]
MLALAALMLLPVGYLALRAVEGGAEALEYLARPRTLAIIANSAVLAGSVAAASTAIGVPLAWLTVRTDLPGRRFWGVAGALPLVIPSYVSAFALVAALGPRGMVQGLLEPLGVARLPSIYGFFGAWLALTLSTYPYVFLSVRAGLKGIDPALEEASRSLGGSGWRTFWRVTLPQLRPSIVAGALLVALYTLSDFGAVSIMRHDVFTSAIYVQYTASFNRGLAAALALVLVALTLVVIWIEKRAEGRARYYRCGVGARRAPKPARLGRWRLPAALFCGGVTGLALVAPLAVLAFWLARGLAAGEVLRDVGGPALRSIWVSGLAAGAAGLLALPVAFLAVRYPSRLNAWLGRLTYVGYALPGVVIALALVFFGVRVAPGLYQTVAMLALAYVIRFLPQSVGSVRASLLQVSPRLEEAARSLGRGSLGAFVSITAPLVRPGLVSGSALVFLTAMKELPPTLLLAPTGYDTLATRIWSATTEAFYARGALPALLLVAVSAAALGVMLARAQDQR